MRLLCSFTLLVFAACHASSTGDVDAASPPDLMMIDAAMGPCSAINLSSDPACNACLAANCCTVITACDSDGGCKQVWDHSALIGCMTNTCATVCHEAPAHCGGINATPQNCADCLYKNCCIEATACGMNDGCLALVYQCLDKQSDTVDDCETMFPAGKSTFETMNACGTSMCPGCF